MTPKTEVEIEMHQVGEFITERETRPDSPTKTLRLSKSDARWVQALLQVKQKEDQECQREKEALQALVRPATFPGGHHLDTGYRTMSAWQLEERAACLGHISLEQLEASMEARKQPGIALYPGSDPGSTEQQDLFRSYEQDVNQAVTHYLEVKWGLFERGWPDPARRSIAFGIADSVQGIYNGAVSCSLDHECIRTFKDLLDRVVILVWRERKAMRTKTSYNESWQGLDLQGNAFVPS